MSKMTLTVLQCRLLLLLRQSSSKGFTLLELLIAAIISGLVVSGLLFLVTELLRIDNRETALEEVQRDTQRAMNYMADELREAVYVYSTPTTVTDPTTGIGASLPTGSTPILAFWKVTPILQSQMPGVCSTTFSGADFNTCEALKIRRASYDLVVYSQIPGPADPWEGQSRISRYVLSQYSNVSTLTETDGYVNPGFQANSFEGWAAAVGETSPSTSAVLVDYIDQIGTSTTAVDCQSVISGSGAGDYILSPPNAPEDTSFFACIRNTDSVVQATQAGTDISRSNQDVYLFLKGDVSARSSSVSPASESSRSPRLQTQVLIRGIINKNPTD